MPCQAFDSEGKNDELVFTISQVYFKQRPLFSEKVIIPILVLR
jgi:glutathionyl-hydroquinone reductase